MNMTDRLPDGPETAFIYTPIVAVTRREDGRYTVEFDWADAFQYAHYKGDDFYETDPRAAELIDAACVAVDAWVRELPKAYVITPATVASLA